MATSTYHLEKALKQAQSYKEWRETAEALDAKKGRDQWRKRDQSSQYDFESIRWRLERLQALRKEGDHRGLLFALNEGIHGNMGGMGKPGLYGYALGGTKDLIVAYIDAISDALEYLAGPETDDIDFEEKLDFFRRASHCFGRSALMLSGSGSRLHFHAGVAKALIEADLLPNILSGSSGGSIISALLGTRSNKQLREELASADMLESAKQSASLEGRAEIVKPEEVESNLEVAFGDITFAEALEISGRWINVSIAPAETHQTSRLMNAITSPQVTVKSAVMASCAVPGVYPPVTLEAKDKQGKRQPFLPTRKWVDGSVSDDLPAKRLARLYGVNHYIVSQTNPGVLPFVTDSLRRQSTLDILQQASRRTSREWINAMSALAHRSPVVDDNVRQFLSNITSVVNQNYIGDINILPEEKFIDPRGLLSTPSPEEVLKMVAEGERAAWARLEMIRVQTKISRTLERIDADYEERVLQGYRPGKDLAEKPAGSRGTANRAKTIKPGPTKGSSKKPAAKKASTRQVSAKKTSAA